MAVQFCISMTEHLHFWLLHILTKHLVLSNLEFYYTYLSVCENQELFWAYFYNCMNGFLTIFIILAVLICQGRQSFSLKVQVLNVFGFVGHMVSVATLPLQIASSHKDGVSRWACLYFSKIWFRKSSSRLDLANVLTPALCYHYNDAYFHLYSG